MLTSGSSFALSGWKALALTRWETLALTRWETLPFTSWETLPFACREALALARREAFALARREPRWKPLSLARWDDTRWQRRQGERRHYWERGRLVGLWQSNYVLGLFKWLLTSRDVSCGRYSQADLHERRREQNV